MSCSFKPISSIIELDEVCHLLNINAKTLEKNESKPVLPNDCLTAISPLGEILVLANYQTICVLQTQPNEGEDDIFELHLSWSKNICQSDTETITSVIVLPVVGHVSKSKKICAQPEWTCIAVGFSSGFIRFFTETGELLMSHRLHNEPLSRLKSQSFTPAQHSFQSELPEEIHAFHMSVICILPGFTLFTTLKALRNQLLKAKSESSPYDIPFTFHKWRFTEQKNISDCVIVGPAPTNSFHHLLTASLCGGFNGKYKVADPHSTSVIACGTSPFIGFHFALEGSSQLILNDVAKVVANKLKSAIGSAVPSWFLGGSSKQNVSPEEVIEPPEDMMCRFGLCDRNRQAMNVVISPLHNFCVVTDFFGRISLVDTTSGHISRLWKGYRDAQCGWLTAEEESSGSKSFPKTGLFLVIYSPDRSSVEVWSMQQGPRIATVQLTEPGSLLYTNHSLFGVPPSQPVKQKIKPHVLFLSNLGILFDVTVPFHCILTEKSSVHARDLHLLKKLRCALRDFSNNDSKLIEEVIEIGKQLTLSAIIKDALTYIVSYVNLTPVLLNTFLSLVKDTLELSISKGDEDKSSVLMMVHQLQSVTMFYEYIYNMHEKPPNYKSVVSFCEDTSELQELSKKLTVSENELKRISNIIKSSLEPEHSGSITKKCVTFASKLSNCQFPEYINLFRILRRDSYETGKIRLDPICSSDQMTPISNLMFHGVIYGNCLLGDFLTQCQLSCIDEEDLVRLALVYWLNKQHGANIFKEMIHLNNVITSLCVIKEKLHKDWWKNVQSQLTECTNPLSAMTGAFVCRGVALKLERNSDQNLNEMDEEIDWTTYDHNSCTWSLLIGQLEDISVLEKSIGQTVVLNEAIALQMDISEVTLQYILKQGRGSVTELVAKWLCVCGVKPEYVIDKSDTEFTGSTPKVVDNTSPNQKNRLTGIAEGVVPHIEESTEAKPMNKKEYEVIEKLKCLKQHFPYSLTCSSLLANMCWEYIQAYEKQPQNLIHVQATVQALSCIQSSHIKQGVCYLLWTGYFRGKFEPCLRLLHKVGKLPKDLLCKQELQLGENQIGTFLQLLFSFFDIYLQATMLAEMSERPKLQHELFWEGQSRLSQTFVQKSLTQPPANHDLLHLLLQATLAFYLMVTFNQRVVKPLNSFFDHASQSAIFTDIHSRKELGRINPDRKLVESRTKFLQKTLSSAAIWIDSDFNANDEIVYNTERFTRLVGRIFDLAAEWSVPSDVLRRHQICDLYINGYDQLAQEITPLVSETALLGSQLLYILGLRLKIILRNTKNTDLKETFACLSPTVISWLDNIKSNEEMKMENIKYHFTVELSQAVVKLLPDDHRDHHMAEILAEYLPQLVNHSKDSDDLR